jgi:RHS repeat-associated protein
VGRRTELWDSTGRTTTTYDDIGRATSVKNPADKIITYSYYDDDRRKETTEPGGGLFTYTYDDAGRMTLLQNPQGDRTTYQYDNADRRIQIQRHSGNSTSIVYDNASQVTNILHKTPGGTILTAYTYTYDDAGTRTQLDEPGVTTNWLYDNAYRLTVEARGGSYVDTFTYDDVGNRATWNDGTAITTYSYDAADQLETAVRGAARTTYTYDNNGNLEVENASGTRTTHTWNDENQLTQVQKTGMTTNVYTFSGDGQRVQIVDSQGTKKPIWDLQNVLLETDGSNVTQVVYTLEPAGFGNLVSQRRGSTTSFYFFDALGSTRKLTSSAGSVTDSYDFRAFGETFASSVSTTNVFRWVGELGYYLDIDRLAYYLRSRPYNPAVGRFLSRDPLSLDWAPFNAYEYVHSAPTGYVDPYGLQAEPPPQAPKRFWPIQPPINIRKGCEKQCQIITDTLAEDAILTGVREFTRKCCTYPDFKLGTQRCKQTTTVTISKNTRVKLHCRRDVILDWHIIEIESERRGWPARRVTDCETCQEGGGGGGVA